VLFSVSRHKQEGGEKNVHGSVPVRFGLLLLRWTPPLLASLRFSVYKSGGGGGDTLGDAKKELE